MPSKQLSLDTEYDPQNLFLDCFDCSNWYEKEKEFIRKHNEYLRLKIKKTRLNNYCPNINIETIFMNTKNSKTNEPYKCVLNLSQRLDLRSSNNHDTL